MCRTKRAELNFILPSGVKQAIEQNISDRATIRRSLKLCRYIFKRFARLWKPFSEPIPISKEHFRNNVNVHYLRELRILKDLGIIETDEKYWYIAAGAKEEDPTLKGECKHYRFNQELVYSNPDVIQLAMKTEKEFQNSKVVRKTKRILKKITVTLSEEEIIKTMCEKITPQTILTKCTLLSDLDKGSYHQITVAKKYRGGLRFQKLGAWLSVAQIESRAKKKNVNAFLYRGKLYVTDLTEFVQHRVFENRNIYANSLLSLKAKKRQQIKDCKIVCARNETNFRLDTNLTNMESSLLQYIRLDGEELTSIDLSNSQFNVLGYTIENLTKRFSKNHNISGEIETANTTLPRDKKIEEKKGTIYVAQKIKNKIPKPVLSKDLRHFLSSAKNGNLYESIQNSLNQSCSTSKWQSKTFDVKIYTRKEVKQMMFEAVFSSHRFTNKTKQVLKENYPSLMQFIGDFKKSFTGHFKELIGQTKGDWWETCKDEEEAREKGKASLAVMLQRIESRIFIDVILFKLLGLGYKVLSKHDSILCKKSQVQAVKSFIELELNAIFGKDGYKLKVEHMESEPVESIPSAIDRKIAKGHLISALVLAASHYLGKAPNEIEGMSFAGLSTFQNAAFQEKLSIIHQKFNEKKAPKPEILPSKLRSTKKRTNTPPKLPKLITLKKRQSEFEAFYHKYGYDVGMKEAAHYFERLSEEEVLKCLEHVKVFAKYQRTVIRDGKYFSFPASYLKDKVFLDPTDIYLQMIKEVSNKR